MTKPFRHFIRCYFDPVEGPVLDFFILKPKKIFNKITYAPDPAVNNLEEGKVRLETAVAHMKSLFPDEDIPVKWEF